MKRLISLFSVILFLSVSLQAQEPNARTFWHRPITVTTSQIKPAPTALGKTIVSVPANADSTRFKWGVGEGSDLGTWMKTEVEAGNPANIESQNGTFFSIGDNSNAVPDFWGGTESNNFAVWFDADKNNIPSSLVQLLPTRQYYYVGSNGLSINEDGINVVSAGGGQNSAITMQPSYMHLKTTELRLSDSSLANEILILRGAGSPEGVATASVGSMYLRTDGGTGTTFYIKESGAGNTGWVAK